MLIADEGPISYSEKVWYIYAWAYEQPLSDIEGFLEETCGNRNDVVDSPEGKSSPESGEACELRRYARKAIQLANNDRQYHVPRRTRAELLEQIGGEPSEERRVSSVEQSESDGVPEEPCY